MEIGERNKCCVHLGCLRANEASLGRTELGRASAQRLPKWKVWCYSADELADTTSSADTLLGDLGELLGANDHGGAGELALAEDLEETLKQKSRLLINNLRTYGLGNIDHSSLLLGGGCA